MVNTVIFILWLFFFIFAAVLTISIIVDKYDEYEARKEIKKLIDISKRRKNNG